MRSTESTLGWPENTHHLPNPTVRTPRSLGSRPILVAPHPPLLSGGWYGSPDQGIPGPGRHQVRQAATKRAGTALFWTLLLGPLGLCYLSTTAGLVASALTAIVLAASWNGMVLVVAWPLAMTLAMLVAPNRRLDPALPERPRFR